MHRLHQGLVARASTQAQPGWLSLTTALPDDVEVLRPVEAALLCCRLARRRVCRLIVGGQAEYRPNEPGC